MDYFPFLRLPTELRLMVYRYVVSDREVNHENLPPHSTRPPKLRSDNEPIAIGILFTNRQLYGEVSELLCGSVPFFVYVDDCGIQHCSNITQDRLPFKWRWHCEDSSEFLKDSRARSLLAVKSLVISVHETFLPVRAYGLQAILRHLSALADYLSKSHKKLRHLKLVLSVHGSKHRGSFSPHERLQFYMDTLVGLAKLDTSALEVDYIRTISVLHPPGPSGQTGFPLVSRDGIDNNNLMQEIGNMAAHFTDPSHTVTPTVPVIKRMWLAFIHFTEYIGQEMSNTDNKSKLERLKKRMKLLKSDKDITEFLQLQSQVIMLWRTCIDPCRRWVGKADVWFPPEKPKHVSIAASLLGHMKDIVPDVDMGEFLGPDKSCESIKQACADRLSAYRASKERAKEVAKERRLVVQK